MLFIVVVLGGGTLGLVLGGVSLSLALVPGLGGCSIVCMAVGVSLLVLKGVFSCLIFLKCYQLDGRGSSP